jgi:hypothetical protein
MCGPKYLKVCLIACLFLCLDFRSEAQDYQFSEALLPYYNQALNYDFRSWPLVDIDTLEAIDKSAGVYINSLAATLQTLIQKQDPAAQVRDEWLKLLEGCEASDDLCVFVKSEVIFHHSLIYFLQGDHFKSFLQFRKVYRSDHGDKEQVWLLKTSGTLNVMLGTVPEQYQWILSILGYRGDQVLGMRQLDDLITQETILSFETQMIKLLFEQYLFDQDTFEEWLRIRTEYLDSPISVQHDCIKEPSKPICH